MAIEIESIIGKNLGVNGIPRKEHFPMELSKPTVSRHLRLSNRRGKLINKFLDNIDDAAHGSGQFHWLVWDKPPITLHGVSLNHLGRCLISTQLF